MMRCDSFRTTVTLAAIAMICAVLLFSALRASGQPTQAQSDQSSRPVSDTTDASNKQSNSQEHTNRLINETSPYLLQHAHNPVDWYPWDEAAFKAARDQNKPIFLSVGYSTCYWCHVMERESFEDEEIASVLNEHFIPVKVDREERPDVDEIYMLAVRILSQGGSGWPMSVFLEPQALKPFYGATYIPRDRFEQLLQQISIQWNRDERRLEARADRVAATIENHMSQRTMPKRIDHSVVNRAINALLSAYDSKHGGFRREGPKFPQPVRLELLLGSAWDDSVARDAVLHTLDRMAMGGMYDQVGGGFHRYSTDREWLVPHFEKMLYDNGQLAALYAGAYERTRKVYYADVVRETLDYVLREMTGESGRFYSAQDAEVDGREGANYVWTAGQVRETLKDAGLEKDIALALEVYGLNRGANFQDPHHPDAGRKNVLFLIEPPSTLTRELGLMRDELEQRLDRINQALLEARNNRPQPGTDDKTITAWSGLMITGLARGGEALGEPRYVNAAKRAAEFVMNNMQTADGGLLRTYREGEARINAFLNDYAFVIQGLIALHKATGNTKYLDRARALTEETRTRFRDSEFGGYYDTLADQSDLFVRAKTIRDGAVPSGNSVMLHNLLDLYELTDEKRYLNDAADTIGFLSQTLTRSPMRAPLAVLALHRLVEKYPDALPGGGESTAQPENPVDISVNTNEIDLSETGKATFNITLEIEDGYHINAHEPGGQNLIGVSVRVVGPGLRATAEYPVGESYEGSLFDAPIRVHTGSVTVPVTVRKMGAVRGRPRFILTYQVCSDKVCYQPQRRLLPIEVKTNSKRR